MHLTIAHHQPDAIQSYNMGSLHKLSPLKIKTATTGVHGDGGGLWLQVSDSGGKYWIFRFTLKGRSRWMGLGPLHTVSLTEARDLALECRKKIRAGIDPIEHRDEINRIGMGDVALAMGASVTFSECTRRYIASHRSGWKNEKHAAQWDSTLTTYCASLRDVPVSIINTGHVIECVNPIWTSKAETASRLRGRIEAILDYARVMEWRSGENPARWKGHLENLLPNISKRGRTVNRPALPYTLIGHFVADLRAKDGITPRALELAILTAARSIEVRGARWKEFDLKRKVWVIPADRMKAKVEHEVPLSKDAVSLLKALQTGQHDALAFPSPKQTLLSDAALASVIVRMNRERADRKLPPWTDPKQGRVIVPHGFRSTFRMWAAECTSYPRDVAEHALAHKLPDAVEAAYQRSTLFEKRRMLMEAWADYCNTTSTAPAEVTPIGRRKSNAAA